MRDFGLASHSNAELVELQRSFVTVLIASVDGKAENAKSVPQGEPSSWGRRRVSPYGGTMSPVRFMRQVAAGRTGTCVQVASVANAARNPPRSTRHAASPRAAMRLFLRIVLPKA